MSASILCGILIMLSGIFKAVADTLKDHFTISVFKGKDPRWWNPNYSFQYVGFIRFTKYRPDAWHLANSFMIIAFCGAVIVHKPLIFWIYELAIAGTLFNLSFNLFYNKILRRG